MNAPVDIAHDVFSASATSSNTVPPMTLDVQKRQPLRSREDRHLQLCVHTLAEQHHARVQQMLSLGQQQLIQRRVLSAYSNSMRFASCPRSIYRSTQLSVYLLHKKV